MKIIKNERKNYTHFTRNEENFVNRYLNRALIEFSLLRRSETSRFFSQS